MFFSGETQHPDVTRATDTDSVPVSVTVIAARVRGATQTTGGGGKPEKLREKNNGVDEFTVYLYSYSNCTVYAYVLQ